MKKIILIIAFISISMLGKAQCNLPYKPLSAFGTDTTAFIIYNFMDRADFYKGKTLKEVTKDLDIPIKYYVRIDLSRGTLFSGIGIYIYDDITVSKLMDSNKDYNVIDIYWETPINVLHPDHKRLIGINWNKAYEYLKDMKIKRIEVSIPRYSKYYEKYKQKETKSYDPNKRKEGDW
ncbi:MAG: hypothetical protein LBS20_01440 [Prevotella sp.]|nr:hypothetical protein [Prevotella sp.]